MAPIPFQGGASTPDSPTECRIAYASSLICNIYEMHVVICNPYDMDVVVFILSGSSETG